MSLQKYLSLAMLSISFVGCASHLVGTSVENNSTRTPSQVSCNEQDLAVNAAIRKVNQAVQIGGYYLTQSFAKAELSQCELSWPAGIPAAPIPTRGTYRGLALHFHRGSTEAFPAKSNLNGETIAAIFSEAFLLGTPPQGDKPTSIKTWIVDCDGHEKLVEVPVCMVLDPQQ